MRNEDNDCIRYLMKEMDPSEELLMERAMMEDEDLLIEVESMRQTLQKLDKLPRRKPSAEVTDFINQKAAEQAQKNRERNQPSFTPVVKYAVAATLALTITAGGAWFFMGSENRSQTETVSSVTTEQSNSSMAASSDYQMVNSRSSQPPQSSDAAAVNGHTRVEPWVDRQNILRFEENFSNQNASYQALIRTATQKLQPMENTTPNTQRFNSIQLTGSGN